MKVQGEKIFSVPTNHFAVVSESGFTLAYSADGEHFTEWDEATGSNETLVVANCAKGMTFKLVGNSGDAYVQY